jgi:(p)ppGpp synthase/HD superfamily hydrolase
VAHTTEYEKSFTSLRHWLLGKEYFMPAEALQFAREWHTGKRKDGVTPEDDHQLQVTQYIRTLHSLLLYPQESIAAALLHDLVEDKPVSIEEIRRLFGDRVGNSVWLLSKVRDGARRSDEEYYSGMANDPIASVVKGSDRIHNSQTMIGVFTPAKQLEYMDETRKFLLPMLKKARRRFPQQHAVYMNTKLILVSQIQLIEAVHAASQPA